MPREMQIALSYILVMSFVANTILLAIIYHEIRRAARKSRTHDLAVDLREAITRLETADHLSREVEGKVTPE